MADSTAPDLDDETTAALTLFNEYVAADRERARRERRVKKAERAKDEAAAVIKKMEADGASADDRAAAETTYREALEMWKRLRDGEEPTEPAADAEPDTGEAAANTGEADAETGEADAETDETTPAEE